MDDPNSLNSSTIQDDSRSNQSLPWVTRFMNTDWNIVGSGNSTSQIDNTTGTTPKPSRANSSETGMSNMNTDYNNTDNGFPITLYQIESGGMGTLSDPANSDNSATPLTPAKRGHWFPRQSYARMFFEFDAFGLGGRHRIHLEIEQDQDTYPRTLTVKLDGDILRETIISIYGFHDDIITPIITPAVKHRIEVQINYGSYVDKGWILKHFWVYFDKYPADVTGQLTHKEGYCNLRYLVEMGPNTILNLKIEHGDETYSRTCEIYVDDNFIHQLYVPATIELDLGDYDDNSVHELRLLIYWQGHVECGKKITILQVHHEGTHVEIDYRHDHIPDSEFIEYVESFYKVYSYHRVDLQLNDSLSSEEVPDTIPEDWEGWGPLWLSRFGNKNKFTEQAGDIDWLWCVFAHYIEGAGGWYSWDTIVVADQSWIDWCFWNLRPISWARRAVLLHEFGHYLGMPHYYAGDCPCYECCYSSPFNCIWETPTYCVWHWQRGAYYESLWHDPCLSTNNWYRQSMTSDFEAYRTLQDSGWMYSYNGYFYCSGIGQSSDWKHGPLFVKELPFSIELRRIRALEADLELWYVGSRMGDLIVMLFDENKERSMVFCLYDSWYSSKSRAYLDYWMAGDDHDNWYEGDHYNTWKATWRFWFDPHTHSSWSLKSELDDGTPQYHTHYTTPYGENTRKIRYIGIQFARVRSYNYHNEYARVLDLRLRYHHDNPQDQPIKSIANEVLEQSNIQQHSGSDMNYAYLEGVQVLNMTNGIPSKKWFL
jgi:hypothetical protein